MKAVKTGKAVKVEGAQGAVTFKKVSGSKRLSVVKASGKIKVKRKTPKGAYKMKVAITAAGDSNYLDKTLVVQVVVRVR